MTVISELVSILTLKTDKSSFKEGETQLTNFARTAQAAIGFDLFGKLSSSLLSYVEQADQLDDTSKALGISAQQLQALGYAAKLSGSDVNDMIGALGRLNNEVGAAAAGVGAQTVLFAKLGVDVSKGMKPMAELLPEIADGISKLPTHAERAAATVQLFGRGARALVPFLEQGREGIKALTDEFEALGGGFTDEFIERAAKVQDELDRVHYIQQRVASTMLSSVLPPFTTFLQVAEKGTNATMKMLEGTEFLGAALATTTALALAQAAALGLSSSKVGQFMRLGAALGVVALAADDVKSFLEGGDSALGQMLERAGLMKTAMALVKDEVAGLDELLNPKNTNKKSWFEDIKEQNIEIGRAMQEQVRLQREVEKLRAQGGGADYFKALKALEDADKRVRYLQASPDDRNAFTGDAGRLQRANKRGLDAEVQQRVYGRVGADVLQTEAGATGVSSVLNMNIEKIEANDPADMARQMKNIAKDAHAQQTEELRRGLAGRVRP
jgi:hypothetical protein